jgi:hypothetical protein
VGEGVGESVAGSAVDGVSEAACCGGSASMQALTEVASAVSARTAPAICRMRTGYEVETTGQDHMAATTGLSFGTAIVTGQMFGRVFGHGLPGDG